MSCVFPGVAEVLASFSLSQIRLITDDLPTLLLPINAYSGLSGLGHLVKSGLLMIYVADLIIICWILDTGCLLLQKYRKPVTSNQQPVYLCPFMSEKYLHDNIVPFETSGDSKKEQVAKMFDSIAFRYDFLNRFLSAGVDISWRKKAINVLKDIQPKYILDVATGTADMALLEIKLLNPDKIIGIDISEKMLEFGREKIEKQGLSGKITLQKGDSETINFPDNSFDAVTVAFGVRNFENLEKGLSEIRRVLKPGGKLVVLEFSKPKRGGFRVFYNLYMKIVAPQFGKMFSKNKEAYSYLNNSIQAFPEGDQFVTILNQLGYSHTLCKTLSLGICTIYCGSR